MVGTLDVSTLMKNFPATKSTRRPTESARKIFGNIQSGGRNASAKHTARYPGITTSFHRAACTYKNQVVAPIAVRTLALGYTVLVVTSDINRVVVTMY